MSENRRFSKNIAEEDLSFLPNKVSIDDFKSLYDHVLNFIVEHDLDLTESMQLVNGIAEIHDHHKWD